jgi:hypothetical protein
MKEEDIKNLIQQMIDENNTKNQYGVNLPPIHSHNLTDSSGGQIPTSSIIESIAITGSAGGVFNPLILDTQKVNNEYITGRKNAQTVYTLPVNVIYGFGVGVHSAFNGGDAEPGTMVFFENGLTLSALWIKTINGWYGISPDLTA